MCAPSMAGARACFSADHRLRHAIEHAECAFAVVFMTVT